MFQSTYGVKNDHLDFAIDMQLLPERLRGFRQKYLVTWDIEALETIPDGDIQHVEAYQNICSVAVASNINADVKYFERESSDPTAAYKLVESFINHLFELENAYQELIPPEIAAAVSKLDEIITSHHFSKKQTREKALRTYLKQMYTLPCYAFNSGRYDLPCIIGLIYNYSKLHDCKMKTIKKGTSYMALTLTKTVGDRKAVITFRDVLNYTAPCSLSKYLKQWGSPLAKSIFPYSKYQSMEEMGQDKDFPSYDCFYSDLTQSNVPVEEYESSKAEFYRRKNLENDHPDKIHSMRDWLKYYNCLDVQPLVTAVNTSFEKFFMYFKIDPNMHLSLPTLAFK